MSGYVPGPVAVAQKGLPASTGPWCLGGERAIAFTATGHNSELAVAAATGAFGLNAGPAFVGVVGPLLGGPALTALVNRAFGLRRRFYAELWRINFYYSDL